MTGTPVGHRGDHGQVSLEFVAMVPLVLLVLAAALQVFFVSAATLAADHAARAAARAHSLGRSDSAAIAAAQSSVDGWAGRVASVTPGGNAETWQVRIDVPVVFPGLYSDRVTVTRSATIPFTATNGSSTNGS